MSFAYSFQCFVICQVRYLNFVAINFRLHGPSSSFASILFVSAWPLWPICRQHDPWQILLELETWAQHLHPKHEELMPWRIRKCQSVKKNKQIVIYGKVHVHHKFI